MNKSKTCNRKERRREDESFNQKSERRTRETKNVHKNLTILPKRHQIVRSILLHGIIVFAFVPGVARSRGVRGTIRVLFVLGFE